MFRRGLFCIALTFFLPLVHCIQAQERNIPDLLEDFRYSYSSGDFLKAEKYLLEALESKDSLANDYLIIVYNNLGVINYTLGRYDEALRYFNLAQLEAGANLQPSTKLADIYNNKARIYGILKEFDKAIEYLEQGIKIYLNSGKHDKSILFSLSTAYLNLGLTYYKKENYRNALEFLEKSKELKLRYNLAEVALPYLNIAKTYVKINNPEKAQKYFLESIASFNREFGEDYYRLAEAYFDYGLFLRSIGKNSEALEIHRKALSICLKNYGEKHTFVSLAYKLLGDHFFVQTDYQDALQL